MLDQKVTQTFPTDALPKSIRAHVWAAEPDAHYVEPLWVPRRLFDVEHFIGAIHDPAVGLGTVVHAADLAGLEASGGSDIVDNPPYPIVEQFTLQALRVTQHEVAIVFPIARLPAAHWIQTAPLRRAWLLDSLMRAPPAHQSKSQAHLREFYHV